MQRWDQYFLEGLGRGVQMAERSADREREEDRAEGRPITQPVVDIGFSIVERSSA